MKEGRREEGYFSINIKEVNVMLTKKNIIVNDLWNKLDDLYKKIKTLESFSKDIEELKELLLLLKNLKN